MHNEPDGDVTHNADAFSATRNKIGVAVLAAAFAVLVGAISDGALIMQTVKSLSSMDVGALPMSEVVPLPCGRRRSVLVIAHATPSLA